MFDYTIVISSSIYNWWIHNPYFIPNAWYYATHDPCLIHATCLMNPQFVLDREPHFRIAADNAVYSAAVKSLELKMEHCLCMLAICKVHYSSMRSSLKTYIFVYLPLGMRSVPRPNSEVDTIQVAILDRNSIQKSSAWQTTLGLMVWTTCWANVVHHALPDYLCWFT